MPKTKRLLSNQRLRIISKAIFHFSTVLPISMKMKSTAFIYKHFLTPYIDF